jgi:hypothetical protein
VVRRPPTKSKGLGFDTASLQNVRVRLASVIPSLDSTHVGAVNTGSVLFSSIFL